MVCPELCTYSVHSSHIMCQYVHFGTCYVLNGTCYVAFTRCYVHFMKTYHVTLAHTMSLQAHTMLQYTHTMRLRAPSVPLPCSLHGTKPCTEAEKRARRKRSGA